MGKIIVDGHGCENADSAPDLGSLVCTSEEKVEWFNPDTEKTETHTKRTYKGLAADVDKLPVYPDLASGSAFYAIDNSNVTREYEHTSGRWYTGE